jgi:hypothetical protein
MRSMMMLLCAGCRHLAPGEVCAPDAQLDFRLSISELQAWEGRTVWVAAQEQAWRGAMTEQVRGAAGPSSRQAVLLSAVVQQGTVSASCPRSLSQNVQPFWAAFIDVDGDGQVTPIDILIIINELNSQNSQSRSREDEGDPNGAAQSGANALAGGEGEGASQSAVTSAGLNEDWSSRCGAG